MGKMEVKRIQRQIILITITLFFIITTCCAVSAAAVNDNDTQLSVNTGTAPVNTSVVISGNVKRCSNGDNFQGVTVTAFKNGVKLASTTTNAGGTYTLNFQSADKVFTVTTSYPGHKSASKTVTVNNNSIGTANFQLGMDSVYVSSIGSDTTGIGTLDNPYKTIQKGLDNVNPRGTVYIANGTYTLSSFSISKDVHIVGANQESTILEGCLFYIPASINFTVINLTIKQSIIPASSIFNSRGSCYIINCTFIGVERNRYPAIYNLGTCYIAGCTFIGHNSSEYRDIMGGGAICNLDTITGLSGCTFINNTAFIGGAIWNKGTIDYIIRCTFTGNSAINPIGTGAGGAICNQGTIDYMNGCTFTDNFVTGTRDSDGGAIANTHDSEKGDSGRINIVSGCTFMGNSATYGGAVFNNNRGSYIVLRDCSFISNTASAGTEIYNRGTAVAEYNWWGSSSGPSSSQLYNVQVSKWLREPLGLGLGSPNHDSNGNESSNGTYNTVNAAGKTTETIGLQKTGMPLNYLLLAVLMVLSGLVAPKRK
jgi:hypothetical protein